LPTSIGIQNEFSTDNSKYKSRGKQQVALSLKSEISQTRFEYHQAGCSIVCHSHNTKKFSLTAHQKSGTGRISLVNFKDLMCSLKHWQMVFKTHAREKMGVLLAERLRDALREVGFVVPDKVMTSLLHRYMRKDGMLRFGDFVSTVMHLHRAFSEYHQRDI
jgi:hypothetical protein